MTFGSVHDGIGGGAASAKTRAALNVMPTGITRTTAGQKSEDAAATHERESVIIELVDCSLHATAESPTIRDSYTRLVW
ncbi:hypothetical protein [Labilithrix luteola]|uniref:hypothetical protein n=1 Tax=Labilithrix luteola TaxID=1391654 RepID=UPI0011BAB148|nr:hypothetical protein [Labilithrix luteola]